MAKKNRVKYILSALATTVTRTSNASIHNNKGSIGTPYRSRTSLISYSDSSKFLPAFCNPFFSPKISSLYHSSTQIKAEQLSFDASQHSSVTYFTCRHTYETTLIQEINHHLDVSSSVEKNMKYDGDWADQNTFTTTVCPGLVRVKKKDTTNNHVILPNHLDKTDKCDKNKMYNLDYHLPDPVYALQILPWAIEVEAESINLLAKSAMEGLGLLPPNTSDNNKSGKTSPFHSEMIHCIQSAPKGSLTVHTIVPGMLKGSPKPPMDRRVRAIAETIIKQMKKTFPCARKAGIVTSASNDDNEKPIPNSTQKQTKWILQLLLLSPEHLVASISPVLDVGKVGGTWPCISLTAGLANAEMPNDDDGDRDNKKLYKNQNHNRQRGKDKNRGGNNQRGRGNYDGKMELKAKNTSTTNKSGLISIPSSAYRKLLEAVSCMQTYPPALPSSLPVVDLGATPGGWTAALRRMGCKVIAVDRADLAPNLIVDDHVTFVKGDAFLFQPPSPSTSKIAKEAEKEQKPQWMVSDIIAFPERVSELLNEWCGKQLAHQMIVTVKFKGDSPNWDALKVAIDMAKNHGYECRAKHFFNNKNEVTLMLVSSQLPESISANVAPSTVLKKENHDDNLEWRMNSMFPLALSISNY